MMTIRASSALHRPVNSYSVARERCQIDEQCKTSSFPARLGTCLLFQRFRCAANFSCQFLFSVALAVGAVGISTSFTFSAPFCA
jgi:hypothetical protein